MVIMSMIRLSEKKGVIAYAEKNGRMRLGDNLRVS